MLNDKRAAKRFEIEETRTKILATVAAIARMEPGSLKGLERLEDLENWDSIAALDFLLEAERQFSFDIQSEGLEKCQTVEDLVRLVVGTTL